MSALGWSMNGRKIGLKVTQRMAPTGPWLEAMRRGDFEVVSAANCHGIPNPGLDVQRYLPSSVFSGNYAQFEDPDEVALYEKDAARDGPRPAARADARIRAICPRYPGA